MSRDTTHDVGGNIQPGKDNPIPWVSHPIDIRISLPFFHTRFYVTVVAGRERRPTHRRKDERRNFPLLTLGSGPLNLLRLAEMNLKLG